MRILVANGELAGAGGVETYLATIVPALQAAGHDVGILHDQPAARGGAQRIAPVGLWHAGVQDEGLDTAMARVREFAPDVCFSHNMRALAVDTRLVGEWPVVKMMHGHFGTCVSGHKAFAFPGVAACTRTFGAGCLACYLPRRCGRANPFVIGREYRWGSEQRSLFGRYRAIVVASGFMRHEYLRAGVSPAAVHAIPLFAPPCAIAHSGDEHEGELRPIDVAFIGRMTTLKGPDVLVDALARAGSRLGRPLAAVFAGDGPELEWLRAQAASRGLAARFPGWVTPDARDQLLRQSSIIAVPSRWPEPFGLVGLEGAVFGTPAVAFDTGGIGEWLVDGENGRLIAPGGGAAAFGDAIAGILGDPAVRRRLATGARVVAQRLTVESHLRRLIPVLEGAARVAVLS